jgi:flagellum-specific peptidoglycan hydrolase FlgJ
MELSNEEQKRVDNHVRLTRQEYIFKWRHLAFENRELYGIPASITMGQAILESGYGNSTLAILTNNHFNIKCKKEWTGDRRLWSDDNPDDCFRVYDSVEESYNDHGDYISSRSWYEFLFAYDITDYKGVLYMIWSNADLYIEDIPHYADRPAAKDLLYYAKIGNLEAFL